MAVEELNAKGIKIGGKAVKFTLMLEDDGGDPKQGTAVAQKLVDAKVNRRDRPPEFRHLDSRLEDLPRCRHSADFAGHHPDQIHPARFQLGFRVVANDAKLGGTLGAYAVNKLGIKKIAVIDDRTAYGQGVADEFIKGAKKAGAGVQIVAKEFTTDKATDFNAILTTIKAKNPDLVFFGGMDSVGGPLLRQMKALGIKARYMGGDGMCTESLPNWPAMARPTKWWCVPKRVA
jgi:branched-chain amino acid transport system substrate-binding protein